MKIEISPKIEKLFVRMGVIYGYTWISLYTDQKIQLAAKFEWQKSLEEFNDAQIERGIERSKKLSKNFAPPLPLFVDYCKPGVEDLGALSVEEAYQAALRRDFSAIGVQKAFDQITSFSFSSMSAKELIPLFSKTYKKILEDELKIAYETEKKSGFLISNSKSRGLAHAG